MKISIFEKCICCIKKNELNILNIVKEYMYHIFNAHFNLYFKVLQKNTCKRCNENKIEVDAEND